MAALTEGSTLCSLSTSRHHVDPGSHHGWEGGPQRGLALQADQGGRSEGEDPGVVPRGAKPTEAFLQGQAGKPALQAARRPAPLFFLVSSRLRPLRHQHIRSPPLIRSASCLHRKPKCLSQEQRLSSQTDTLGRQLALTSVAFGPLNSPFILLFLKPFKVISRK